MKALLIAEPSAHKYANGRARKLATPRGVATFVVQSILAPTRASGISSRAAGTGPAGQALAGPLLTN